VPHASLMPKSMNRPSELLVLAGGFGTRLRSAIGEVPKPLAPVRGRPFLYYLIENWRNQGVTKLTFLLHHKAKCIEDYLCDMKAEGQLENCDVHTVTEPKPLGTGGAVAYAVRQLGLTGSFLVANADTWLGSGVGQISGENSPAMAVLLSQNTERYGAVQIHERKVVSFQEKQMSQGKGLINAGLYHLPAAIFQNLEVAPFSLERDIFPKLVAEGELRAVKLETDFMDIGVPDDYSHFCHWIESERSEKL
jgi:D-glycero-alpha-D-manno-heptose 1-phosphate guanylyltransferase